MKTIISTSLKPTLGTQKSASAGKKFTPQECDANRLEEIDTR